jgi:hypothetical protein
MRLDASYNLCSKLGSKLIFWRNYGSFSFAIKVPDHFPILHKLGTPKPELGQKLGIPVLLHINQFVWVFLIKNVSDFRSRYFWPGTYVYEFAHLCVLE